MYEHYGNVLYDCKVTEKEVKNTISKIKNNKTRGNDSLTKELLEWFWFKILLLLSFKMGFGTKKLSTSQK